MQSKLRILILGYIVRGPLGGMAWHHFQYVYGLKQMGHEVLFLEDSDNFACCYNPETYELSENPQYGLRFIQIFFSAFNMQKHWAYHDAHTGKWFGQTQQNVFDFCEMADIVLNISGVNPLRDWWASIPYRILIDTDPVFTQIKHLTDEKANQFAKAHTHFASFGENFGKPVCTIPDDQFQWQPTRQPVCIELWRISQRKMNANWTTVMQWDSYKTGEFNGSFYGMKSHSFKPFIALPGFLETEKLELALGSSNAPRKDLEMKGWIISDPFVASKTPLVFQEYIAGSKGEWTVSKHGYIETKSGWFSERTLNYMASGKPVVIQDTGFSNFIPVGSGILTFSTLEDGIEQIKNVNRSYEFHCAQARNIVEEYFRADKVLTKLLDIIV